MKKIIFKERISYFSSSKKDGMLFDIPDAETDMRVTINHKMRIKRVLEKHYAFIYITALRKENKA